MKKTMKAAVVLIVLEGQLVIIAHIAMAVQAGVRYWIKIKSLPVD